MKLLLSLTLALLINVAYAQTDTILDCAIEANKKGMVYLKSFQTKLVPVNGDESGKTWSVVLNKGVKYRFYLCENNEDKPKHVVLTLFDKTHPESEPYGSTQKKGHFYFECNKAGTYEVSIRYKKGAANNATSAVGVLLFVKRKK
ncbi:MAG: hypothetical protein B6I20_05015 [Bacteroidetes bacterium 4572_117]|nr:MAG: hypothetical protein B6I20_05015 [Bacteroidetes bacterium 4572_117]